MLVRRYYPFQSIGTIGQDQCLSSFSFDAKRMHPKSMRMDAPVGDSGAPAAFTIYRIPRNTLPSRTALAGGSYNRLSEIKTCPLPAICSEMIQNDTRSTPWSSICPDAA
jgi:hypothetical protein